jgi:hypothetical protein
MSLCIGEVGFALMMLTSTAIGIHLALVVLFGVSLAAAFYWLIPLVAASLMALVHPRPHRSLMRRSQHRVTSRSCQ